jgi:hypothetical protein
MGASPGVSRVIPGIETTCTDAIDTASILAGELTTNKIDAGDLSNPFFHASFTISSEWRRASEPGSCELPRTRSSRPP